MTNEKLREELLQANEMIVKLQQQLKQAQSVIAILHKEAKLWLLPWTMPPREVQAFHDNNKGLFGPHSLMIPSSCVTVPTLVEIKRADEEQVREWIKDANKCTEAIIAKARQQATAQRQQQQLQKIMAQAQPAAPVPLPQSKFDSGAVEIPSFKKDGMVFSLPTFDKKKRVFTMPNGSTPGMSG